MREIKNLRGKRFGMWEVLEKWLPRNNKTMWVCRCGCDRGTIKSVYACNLISGKSKSCGCERDNAMRNKMTKHGERRTKLYGVWASMINRCEKPNVRDFSNYGGRGICVCEEWHKYENFMTWAKQSGYAEGLEINRIDNDGNYEPSNCRWDTKIENMNNTRRTKKYTYQNKEYTVRQLSNASGFSCKLIRNRLARGWSVEDAITIKAKIGNNQKLRRVI